jgi:hypothetical protein
MAFNINDIRAQLTLGGARPSLFQVTITNPIAPLADLKVPFLTVRAELPASTLGAVAVPYFGRKIFVAGDRNFSPWTVTIINDEDFLIRNAMETWNNSINAYEANINQLGSGAPSLYKSQATVTHFGKAGEILRVYQFNGLWPAEVSSINLDWATQDQLEEFNVTFLYDSFEIVGGITGNAGGA